MKDRPIRKKELFILIISIIIGIIIWFNPVDAKGTTGIIERNRHLYFYKNGQMYTGGWFNYKGNRYYAHKTASKKYPKGSLTRHDFRICSRNRWYAFDEKGRMCKKDWYLRKGPARKILYAKIRKNYTVQYIRAGRSWRYSTAELRYQYAAVGNRYRTVEGMQFIPSGVVDWQK